MNEKVERTQTNLEEDLKKKISDFHKTNVRNSNLI